jgi:hypothetical protein
MANADWKQLDLEDLRSFAHLQGPCVTLQVPDSRPGTADAPRKAQLRQLTHTAVEALGNFSPKSSAETVANALKTFVETIDIGGGPGYTVFVAPGHETVLLTPRVEASAIASRYFNVLPLLAAASAPKDFYAVGVSRKCIRLWHVTPADCEEVALPHTVPSNLELAEGVDQSDHNLQNRSSIGANAGNMTSLRFGTVSDYDSEALHLHYFFGLVGKGLRDVVKDAPLFLVGTRPDVWAFRRAAHGANFLEGEWHENPAHCSAAQVETEARAAAAGESYRKAERAMLPLSEIKEKILGDAAGIFKAASEGRVHQLFVAEKARMAAAAAHVAQLHANEDVFNATAVQTLRTGGTVYVLPGEVLPNGEAIAAVLRY